MTFVGEGKCGYCDIVGHLQSSMRKRLSNISRGNFVKFPTQFKAA
jgi:hypothetical protein